ncbi:MAG TPA: hypothetical protein VFY39_10275, partial [Gammaproteobacteria bacterium]|nr:hypothetical protein [Gammaproteobacteria bacterium]
QGLTLPGLISVLHFKSDASRDDEAQLAREAMHRAALEAANELVASHGLAPDEAVAVTRFVDSSGSNGTLSRDQESQLWLEAAAAQRRALLELWQNDRIGDDVLIRLEREIDLVEARLSREE